MKEIINLRSCYGYIYTHGEAILHLLADYIEAAPGHAM
jgi:hypothetical protein